MSPIISCPDFETLSWFLERTDFSIVYAHSSPSQSLFPGELKEVAAAQKAAVIDLAITSTEILSKIVGEPVHPGATAIFAGIEFAGMLPSALKTQEAVLLDTLLSLSPQIRQAKQEVRTVLVTPLVTQVLAQSALGLEDGIGTHKWTDLEMNQTIDLHLAHRADRTKRAQAIEELARNLKLSVGQVTMAVNAVGSLDPEDPRRYPRPSNRLARLWKQRGLANKLAK